MTPRVAHLRKETLETRPWLSAERARLLTEFYRAAPPASVPVTRALAFKYLLEHKTIHIGDGELVVGERGPAPKGTPTYPELCCHTTADLDVLAVAPAAAAQTDPATASWLSSGYVARLWRLLNTQPAGRLTAADLLDGIEPRKE